MPEKKQQQQQPVTEVKNDFDGLVSRLNMVEERISEFEDVPIENSQT